MFKKILIANRGEIAVRVIRACRDLGIETVALYEGSDISSLHVRLASEAVRLTSSLGYMDSEQVLKIALESGAEAIHPGYGFLAEEHEFVRACEAAGIVFIGPPSDVVAATRDSIGALDRVRAAGFPTPRYLPQSYGPADIDAARAQAETLGYPIIIKAARGGRGRGTRFVTEANKLEHAIRQAQAEAKAVYGDDRVYLEQAIVPARQIEVQILGDHAGNLIHLGDRDGSIQRHSQKLIAEAPVFGLTPEQHAQLWQMGLDIARLFQFRSAGSVEFVVDQAGRFYFTEVKARIQLEHPVAEKVTQVDIVREQIRIAAGETLSLRQDQVQIHGCAMQCRINAEDPWNHFMPSPGRLDRFRIPGGPNVRVDTYAYAGCDIPVGYDPILAKLIVWGETRAECIERMQRALQEFTIRGVRTTLPLYQRVLQDPEFIAGGCTTDFLEHPLYQPELNEVELRDMAIAVAVAYATRNLVVRPVTPERLQSGWHRGSRRLPS